MDSIASPFPTQEGAPTSSTDPHQQAAPRATASGDTKNITAHDTVPTATEPSRTDGPKNPDPSSGYGIPDPGTEHNVNMKGTAAPGSHSELFGLRPDEDKVHPPPSSGPGGGVVGTTMQE